MAGFDFVRSGCGGSVRDFGVFQGGDCRAFQYAGIGGGLSVASSVRGFVGSLDAAELLVHAAEEIRGYQYVPGKPESEQCAAEMGIRGGGPLAMGLVRFHDSGLGGIAGA